MINPDRNSQATPASDAGRPLNDNSVVQQAGPRVPIPLPNPAIPLTPANNPLTGRISSIPSWETALQNWVNQAPSLEYYDRIDVAEKIRDCYARGEATLDLSGSNITSLEGIELPDGLTTLDLSFSDITSLAEVTLPARLTTLNLRSSAITSLAGVTLPARLTTLNLYNSQITGLEGVTLPDGLTTLDLRSSAIISLAGVTLPDGLTTLDLSYSQITSLAGVTLPARLTTINLRDSQITSLAGVRLTDGLKMLDLGLTAITSLEGVRLPDGLTTLDLDYSLITSLPLALASFPSTCNINTENCRIDARASLEFQEAIDRARQQDPSRGPQWQTTIYEENPLDTGTLEQLLDQYVQLARAVLHNPKLQLSELHLSDEEKDLLNPFLTKLKSISDFKNPRTRGGLVCTVYNILQEAAASTNFKTNLFVLIHEALDSCGDRVAITLNRIDLQRRMDTSVDIDLLIGYRRLQQIQERAEKIVRSKGLGDAIETMLYLQVRLHETLHLPIVTEGMLYPAMAGISDEELKETEEYVLSQTTSEEDIVRILTETPSTVYDNEGKPIKENGVSVTNPFNFSIPNIWNRHLEKTYPERFKAIEPTDDEMNTDPYSRRWEERRKQLIQELTPIEFRLRRQRP